MGDDHLIGQISGAKETMMTPVAQIHDQQTSTIDKDRFLRRCGLFLTVIFIVSVIAGLYMTARH